MQTTAKRRAATFLTSLIVLFGSALPATAGTKGGFGRNGQHARPFFIVAHNPNELLNVDQALAAGANALEPDIMKFSDDTTVNDTDDHVNSHAGPSGLFVYHDDTSETSRLPVTVEDYFDHIHEAVLNGANVALITLDIKSPAARYLATLRATVLLHLNHGGVNVNIIYSVGTLKDASVFAGVDGHLAFPSTLTDNEGIMVDGENNPANVLNELWQDGGIRHIAFGNGSLGVSLGLAPNVVPSIDEASYLRTAVYWDKSHYENPASGTGFGVAIPYAYPIPMPATESLPSALLNNVDGLIPDGDFQPQVFQITVDNIRQLRDYIDHDPDHYVATAVDNPFYVAPEAYALSVATDSGILAGTTETITFKLTGSCGSASIAVDGDFLGRFHHGDVTFVTLPSKNLGTLTSLQLFSSGTNDWKPGRIQVNSARWGIPLDQHLLFATNPSADFTGLVVNSSESPSLPISGGHACDNTPPKANPTAAPSPDVYGWNDSDVTVTWNWTDESGGSGLRTGVCGDSTAGRAEGSYRLQATCSDNDGNESVASYSVQIDKTAPAVHCGVPDGKWHPTDVSVTCNGSDGLSGLVNPAFATFALGTGVPVNTETSNASTSSRVVADQAGNTTTAGPITSFKVDKKAPVITINQPSNGGQYTHADTLRLDYSVTDGGSGVASFPATLNNSVTVGGRTLASGQDIALLASAPLGQNVFEIQATDNVGNKRTSTVIFNIVATPQSLIADLSQLQGNGLNQRGNSLSSKLAEGANDFAAGNFTAARLVYNAFINEAVAQTGKSITPAAAAILIADARYVIGLCQ